MFVSFDQERPNAAWKERFSGSATFPFQAGSAAAHQKLLILPVSERD